MVSLLCDWRMIRFCMAKMRSKKWFHSCWHTIMIWWLWFGIPLSLNRVKRIWCRKAQNLSLLKLPSCFLVLRLKMPLPLRHSMFQIQRMLAWNFLLHLRPHSLRLLLTALKLRNTVAILVMKSLGLLLPTTSLAKTGRWNLNKIQKSMSNWLKFQGRSLLIRLLPMLLLRLTIWNVNRILVDMVRMLLGKFQKLDINPRAVLLRLRKMKLQFQSSWKSPVFLLQSIRHPPMLL